VDLSKLLPLLEERTKVDMERHISDLAVDYMQAYYKVERLNLARRPTLMLLFRLP
jgi:hypothetical protein